MNVETPEIDTPPTPDETPAKPRKVRWEAHYNDDQTEVIWEAVEVPVTFTSKLPTLPVLNRRERRTLRKYVRHKAALQAGIVKRRYALAGYGERCGRCNLYFLGPTHLRCQCQVQQHRRCAMCKDAEFMASQQEWRQTNVCPGCAAQIREQRENEEASRSAAYDAYYEQRRWDDEQHRLAREGVEEAM